MIKKISVDGFRSLSAFELTLEPGLNILVGPNGSGKTNIISFFEFLGAVVSGPVGEAVSSLGGAGAIFRKLPNGSFQDTITVSILGCLTDDEKSKKASWYQYDFAVSLSDDKDFVYLASQRLLFAWNVEAHVPLEEVISKSFDWHLDVGTSAKPREKSLLVEKFAVNKLNLEKVEIPPHMGAIDNKRQYLENVMTQISEILSAETAPFFSFVRYITHYFHLVGSAAQDMWGGEAINIDPAKAKLNQDGAAPPGIRRDGSGLTATLFALSRDGLPIFNRRDYYFFPPRPSLAEPESGRAVLQRIRKLAKLIIPNLKDLVVVSSALDNLTQVTVEMSDITRSIKLPFSALSDGTVKWIALITAIITHRNIFAIEEPENFLHPHVQRELLNIMRSETNERMNQSFIIMSTHSESLLNAAFPSEVIVVTLDNGMTRARRPKNPNSVMAEISKTGFGLGHYYVSDALNDA